VKRNWSNHSCRASDLVLGTILLAGMVLTGCSKSAGSEPEKEGVSDTAASPVPVRAVIAEPQTLRPTLQLVGRVTLDPAKVATIGTPVDCMVESLPASEGQHVAKDAPIIQLDCRPAELEVAKAAAALAKSRATYAMLKAGPRAEDIEVARQDLQSRRTELESAQEVVKGKQELRQKDVVSPVELQEAQRKYRAAEAAVKSAAAKLAILEKGPRPEEIAQAEADVQAAGADDALARYHLERCTVRAPIEGNLVKVAVHPGMGLAIGSPMAEIVDLRRVQVWCVVPLSRLSEVQAGAPAKVVSAGYPDKPFEGKVVRISHQAEADTGDLAIWLDVENPDSLLRRDMVVRMTLETTPVEAKVVVPESAVIELEGNLIAMVIRDGKTHNVQVKPGKRVGDLVEILEGIKPGDQVITSGGYGLQEGYPVTIQQAATQPTASEPGTSQATTPAEKD
jgi:multidrug efflux pump subunit AcrA (membrane-fusion protein)